MKKINFGTDGWRGIIADDFTYENVDLCGWAIVSYIKENLENERGVVLGYDSRFTSKESADLLATIFLNLNIANSNERSEKEIRSGKEGSKSS